jgi:hypothetical protein
MGKYKQAPLSISSVDKAPEKDRALQKVIVTSSLALPTPEKKHISIITGTRSVAASSLAMSGASDPRGFQENVREWIRTSEDSANADASFFAKRASSKNTRLWNDPSVPDSDFAADEEVMDARQLLSSAENLNANGRRT